MQNVLEMNFAWQKSLIFYWTLCNVSHSFLNVLFTLEYDYTILYYKLTVIYFSAVLCMKANPAMAIGQTKFFRRKQIENSFLHFFQISNTMQYAYVRLISLPCM